MFSPINAEDFLKSYKENNPGEDVGSLREVLANVVEAKKNGAVCNQCKRPIWAVGSAVVGWDGCFTCITGEADNSKDCEIDGVVATCSYEARKFGVRSAMSIKECHQF